MGSRVEREFIPKASNGALWPLSKYMSLMCQVSTLTTVLCPVPVMEETLAVSLTTDKGLVFGSETAAQCPLV